MKTILLKLYFLICLGSVLIAGQDFILPIPKNQDIDKAKSKLGEKLFFDTSLSRNKTVSCFSCHDVFLNGADSKRIAVGIDQKKVLSILLRFLMPYLISGKIGTEVQGLWRIRQVDL